MSEPLLRGLRVVDLADGKLEMVGRFLADLGADVVRVEPLEGSETRRRGPLHEGASLYFAARNANKRGVALDLTSEPGLTRLRELVAQADILIETEGPAGLGRLGLDREALPDLFPGLVVLAISDFGLTGPYSSWQATDWVQLALGTQLGRSGLPHREPLVPPGGMSHETSAIQAAFAAMVAHAQAIETGVGDVIDFSIHEATLQVMDAAIGTVGTAAMGASAANRGRMNNPYLKGVSNPYPIFPCVDGHVRLLVLAPRQWRAMRAWLGEPAEFQDDALDTLHGRVARQTELQGAYREFFKDKHKHEIAREGQKRGIPIAVVLTAQDVIAEEHFEVRGAFVDAEIAPGLRARVPSGFVEVDDERVGFRLRAPEVGEHDDQPWSDAPRAKYPTQQQASLPRRPLEGIRVLDFGVIVFGAEVGRLLADMGADVIKVENEAFPDNLRHAMGPVSTPVNSTFAIGHRNQKSFGVNLRSAEGLRLFGQLVAKSDVVLSNFKPGTLEKLGLGYDTLSAMNPRIVLMAASGFGHTGPSYDWLGYGPLVRCTAGLTSLWRYPEDPDGFCDAITIYPDHYSARVAAAAVMAALIRRSRTGEGSDIRLSQAEATINQLAELYIRESLEPGSVDATGNHSDEGAPWGLFRCAGDDAWVVITVRDDAEWRRFARAIGDPDWAADLRFDTVQGRLAAREDLDRHVSAWTTTQDPGTVTATLQAARVSAGEVRAVADLAGDPHLEAREFIALLPQPGFDEPLPMENRPFHSRHVPAPALGPAPVQGEHTRELAASLLGLDHDEIERLIADGILEAHEGAPETTNQPLIPVTHGGAS